MIYLVVNKEVRKTYKAVSPKQTHPRMNASPPKGAMTPNQRLLVNAIKYKLPENNKVPTMNSQPAVAGNGDVGNKVASMPAISSARAWIIW